MKNKLLDWIWNDIKEEVVNHPKVLAGLLLAFNLYFSYKLKALDQLIGATNYV